MIIIILVHIFTIFNNKGILFFLPFYFTQILDISDDSKVVRVFFYGDNTNAIVFKSRLTKFNDFMENYALNEEMGPKMLLRHKGIKEAMIQMQFRNFDY